MIFAAFHLSRSNSSWWFLEKAHSWNKISMARKACRTSLASSLKRGILQIPFLGVKRNVLHNTNQLIRNQTHLSIERRKRKTRKEQIKNIPGWWQIQFSSDRKTITHFHLIRVPTCSVCASPHLSTLSARIPVLFVHFLLRLLPHLLRLLQSHSILQWKEKQKKKHI